MKIMNKIKSQLKFLINLKLIGNMRLLLYNRLTLILYFNVLIFSPSFSQMTDKYYIFQNNYPDNVSVFWGGNDALTNGITHDDNNWYVSALSTDCIGRPGGDWDIKKIPVSSDLINGGYNERISKGDCPGLGIYTHAGDIDHYKYGNTDYLIVPFEKPNSLFWPAIAVFRCSPLSFVFFPLQRLGVKYPKRKRN